MKIGIKLVLAILFLVSLCFTSGCAEPASEIERPERIESKRVVVYDKDTYDTLANKWQEYYLAFPSEDAYANWMYASRYAGHEDYEEKLEEGLEEYPANPVLLYLSSMLTHGAPGNVEQRKKLERAVILDQSFIEPWFSLVVNYMEAGDFERMDVALRNLLRESAISEEVMDYSYNMLAGLEEDAILITNGDNDTYPGWILTRVLEHRPDVRIVNRSLLNTSWYPLHVIEEGVPRFITGSELEEFRETTKPPFGDKLITRIVDAAEREGRPVYFSLTLYPSEVIDGYMDRGRMLGLVSLVTTPKQPYADDLAAAATTWTQEFRTGGLDSWKVHFGKENDAGRMMMKNYPANIHMLIDPLREHAPGYLRDMFLWYRDHCEGLCAQKEADEIGKEWSRVTEDEVIHAWCRQEGYGF